MRLDVISDLHLNFFRDFGGDFTASWIPEAPVLVLAGDVGDARWWRESLQHLRTLCEHYEHVLYVAGNHDYYGTSLEEGDERFRRMEDHVGNFHWLEQNELELDGVKFAGCTLWFKDDPMGIFYENGMNDFRLIQGLKPWVYHRNQQSQEFLKDLRDVDVVITHHMPTYFSVAEEYEDNPLNRYFLCAMDDVILDLQPKLWVHGHTHIPCDYHLGNTRVLCNPKGYPEERGLDRPYGPVTVEV